MGIVIASYLAFTVQTRYGVREPWSPAFGAKPLPPDVVQSDNPQVVHGAALLHKKGCLYCHTVSGIGGHRGPELSRIGDQLNRDQLIIRINNGGYNMPAFAGSLSSQELTDIVEFLLSRRRIPAAGEHAKHGDR